MRQYLDILNEVGEDEISKPTTIYVTSRTDDKYLGLIAKNPNQYNTQEAKQVHENALEVLAKYSQYISGGESAINELNDKEFRFNGLLVDELEAARKRAEARRDDPAAAELQETIYGYVHYAKTAKQWDGEPPVKSEEINELLTVMFGEQYYFMSKEDIAKRLEQEKSMFRSLELTNAPMNDEMKVQKEIVDRLDAIVSDDNQRLIWSEVGQQLDTDLGDGESELETGTSDAVAPGRPTTDDGAPNDMGDEPPTGSSGPSGDGEGTAPFRQEFDVDADQDFDGDPEDFGPGTGGSGRGDGSSEVDRRDDDSKPAPFRPDVDVDADQDFDGDPEDFGPGTGGSGRGDGSSEVDRRDDDSRPAPFRQEFDVDADQDFDGDPEDFGPGGTGTGRGDGSTEADRRTSDASSGTGIGSGSGTAPSYNVDADQDFYGDADGFGPGTGGSGRGDGSSEVDRRTRDASGPGTNTRGGTGYNNEFDTEVSNATAMAQGQQGAAAAQKPKPKPAAQKPKPAAQKPKYYPGVTEPDYNKSLRIAQQSLKRAQDKLKQSNISNLDKIQAQGEVQSNTQKIKMYQDHLLANPRTERGKLIHHRNMLNRSAVASGQAGDQKTRAGYKKQAAEVSQQLKTVKESTTMRRQPTLNEDLAAELAKILNITPQQAAQVANAIRKDRTSTSSTTSAPEAGTQKAPATGIDAKAVRSQYIKPAPKALTPQQQANKAAAQNWDAEEAQGRFNARDDRNTQAVLGQRAQAERQRKAATQQQRTATAQANAAQGRFNARDAGTRRDQTQAKYDAQLAKRAERLTPQQQANKADAQSWDAEEAQGRFNARDDRNRQAVLGQRAEAERQRKAAELQQRKATAQANAAQGRFDTRDAKIRRDQARAKYDAQLAKKSARESFDLKDHINKL